MLNSCRKDRLVDDKEFFVGKWRWIKTIKSLDQPQFIFTDPITEVNNYKIEFVKCGKMKYLKNNEEVFTKRIKFLSVGSSCNSQYCGYNMSLNKDVEIRILVYNSSKDTIYVSDYPFDTYIDGNGNPANYWNIYVRE